MATEYTLSEDTAKRLLRMMRWVEHQQQQGASGTVERNLEVPNVQLVRVDGGGLSAIDADLVSAIDADLVYPFAHVVQFNAETGTLDELGEVYLIELNGNSPVGNTTYLAVQSGEALIAGVAKTVFTTAQPCCDAEPPTDCECDLEAIGTVCATFSYISVNGYSSSPQTATMTWFPISQWLSGYASGIYIPGAGSHFIDLLILCIEGTVRLVLRSDEPGRSLVVPLIVSSCDPFSAYYFGPSFDWQPYPGSWVFHFGENSISIVGPGACPP